MNKKLIDRYYEIASDFNDSISLISILLIINKKSELTFPELKAHLVDLDFNSDLLDDIEDVALSIESQELKRLVRLLSPIDQLFVRERVRNIPSVITEGRKKMKKKTIRVVKCKKTKKITLGLFGEMG
jgi:hypothetical protein